ncbi:hypothetical protein [Cognatishimia maritima]|uniref:Uncharacterized protein n=1 Tax=Cognatishimia maritima TaxID=870908 RepID=A0A1M5JCL4_9RHOB|nr:hypothetical protein [Cognatishimia maritima]SHG38029.1 hypothetical protein SAMN04488044_0608 [Cognatishimia maritima]
MSEIADLENRLSAALDRIARGMDAVVAGDQGAETDEALADRVEELESELEAERSARALLEDQIQTLSGAAAANNSAADKAEVEALKKAHAEELETLRAAHAAERDAWEGLNSRLVRMRRTTKLMRSSAAAMRQAATAKLSDPEAINQSLAAELEALQAEHELERAETDVILKTLQPLLGDPEKDSQTEHEDEEVQ